MKPSRLIARTFLAVVALAITAGSALMLWIGLAGEGWREWWREWNSSYLALYGILLAVGLAVLAAIFAGLFVRPRARTPAEVISLIDDFLNSTDERAWDEFESVPIDDPYLESVRRRAIPMGPPNADEAGLRALVAELVTQLTSRQRG